MQELDLWLYQACAKEVCDWGLNPHQNGDKVKIQSKCEKKK